MGPQAFQDLREQAGHQVNQETLGPLVNQGLRDNQGHRDQLVLKDSLVL